MSSISEQLEERMYGALTLTSQFDCRRALDHLITSTKKLHDDHTEDDGILRIRALVFGHLASLSSNASERTKYRALSLRTCSDRLKEYPDSSVLVTTYANAAVDWFFDSLSMSDQFRLRGVLARARKECQRLARLEESREQKIHLLAQLASVLRAQAVMNSSGSESLTERALATSKVAHNFDSSHPIVLLDLGQSLWANARWSQSEEHFYRQMQEAEKFLLEAHNKGLALATLGLSRLFRQTYRPAQAIDWFVEYSKREAKRRLVLSNVYLVGEAAIMLVHRSKDKEGRSKRLEWCKDILQESLDAGYNNARTLVALARLHFALNDEVGGLGFLQAISRNHRTDWTRAVAEARHAIDEENFEYLYTAFALGIGDGLVWNSLGTFAKDVLGDIGQALDLYAVAEKLSPHSPVIHTNIARICIKYGDSPSLISARKHIDQAKKYSDYSFRWWKPLERELEEKTNSDTFKAYTVSDDIEWDSLDKIYSEFVVLDRPDKSATMRGKKLEALFFRMLKLTYGTRKVAGSTSLDSIQSDASFEHGSFWYRAEISWDSSPNDRSEIDKLIARLRRTAGTRGLLVSMSGFTSGVLREIEHERGNFIILTLDKTELDEILSGRSSFDGVMDEKLSDVFRGAA